MSNIKTVVYIQVHYQVRDPVWIQVRTQDRGRVINQVYDQVFEDLLKATR